MTVTVEASQIVEPIESIDIWLEEKLIPLLERGLSGQVADIDYGKSLAQIRRYVESKSVEPAAVLRPRSRGAADRDNGGASVPKVGRATKK